MRTFRPSVVALLASLAMLVCSACGATTRVGSDRTLRVALGEYRVIPQAVHAPSGLLSIWVHNYGRLSHSLVISHNGVTEASTDPIPPGGGTALETYLTPGQYVMASTVLADEALGAYGTLSVGR